MEVVDTFWVVLKGNRVIEVFQGDKPGSFVAVNPKEYKGIIYRGPKKVFKERPNVKIKTRK